MINKLVMLSGGIDSAVLVAFLLQKQQHDPETVAGLFMNYGQPAARQEETAAAAVARSANIQLKCLDLTQVFFNNTFWNQLNNSQKGSIHGNYFPARNLMLTSVAIAWLASLEGGVVYSGANLTDARSGFPDCSADFWHALNRVSHLGVSPVVTVSAPFCTYTKTEVVQLGIDLRVPFEKTYSCYEGFNSPCGQCEACKLRRSSMEAVNYVSDL